MFFLNKFIDDKTPSMILKELDNIKMGNKVKVKDFNQKSTCIMNKFPTDVQLDDYITKGYYMSPY